MILSLLYRLRPDQCRLIMVDPKMLELSVYDGIPHLLTPVVTDPKKAVVALKWAVREMEERYKKMSKLGVRNIEGYNARLAEAKAKGEKLTRTVHTGYDKESGEAIYENEELDLEPLPFIVVIVDEMADLMMVAGKDIEGAVQRLAQMARAAGLHVILATQRPSVDVITGTIKANFPTRISFQVTSKIDSRTILGEQGAEQLLGQGDMLHMAGGGRISRVHGPFCSDEEVEKVVRHLKSQGTPQYLEAVTAADDEDEDGNPVFDATGMGQPEGGDLYQQAVQVVMRDRKASTSYIQRRLQIGYNRAASLMERMEKEGVVGQANHAGKREILVGRGGGGALLRTSRGIRRFRFLERRVATAARMSSARHLATWDDYAIVQAGQNAERGHGWQRARGYGRGSLAGRGALTSAASAETIPLPTPAPYPKEGAAAAAPKPAPAAQSGRQG